MKIILTDENKQHEIYRSMINIRVNYRTSALPFSSTVKDLSIKELRFKGLNYLFLNLEAEPSLTIKAEYTRPGYWACFVQEGKCTVINSKEPCSVTSNHYTCQAIPQSVTLTFGQSTKVLFINIATERIQGLKLVDERPRILLPDMHKVIFQILECTEDCPIKCIFIESKILSLLYMFFEELQSNEPLEKKNLLEGFTDTDIQKLRAAKVYIVKNIAKNYTLIELARQVGLNDFKLKKGFKELFGSTVFTYRHCIRMEKAKDMLESGFQVNEICEEVGYKHPHHFSTAFKKYFNTLPSLIKTNKV